MTKEELPKGQTIEKEEVKKAEMEKVSVEQIFNMYPLDRDKARDAVLVEMSRNMARIAASLETIPQALLGINQKLENMSRKSKVM